MTKLERLDTLTAEQIEKAPAMDTSLVDSIRSFTMRCISLIHGRCEDDEVLNPTTNPKINLDEFKTLLGEHLEGTDIAADLLPALYESADSEGKLAPRALREFMIALNVRRDKLKDKGVNHKCKIMVKSLQPYDSDCIAEERTFSKQYILELIMLFALSKKLDLDQMKIVRIRTNKQEDLLILEVEFPKTDVSEASLITYNIKGRYSGNEAGRTSIDQNFFDEDGIPCSGETIMEYIRGKWVFDPPNTRD
jgi:hypothetical protein